MIASRVFSLQQDKARFTGSVSPRPSSIDVNHKNSDGPMQAALRLDSCNSLEKIYLLNDEVIENLSYDSKKDLGDYDFVDSTASDKMVRLYGTDKIVNVQ